MQINCILCGALTAKPTAYTYRSWELENKDVFDVFDSFNNKSTICIKGLTILRIIPNKNSFFTWVSDKFRFFFDAFI